MPANLPPEVIELIEKAKLAKSPQEKISIYLNVIALTPKHKGTEKFLAEIKRKVAELRREVEKRKKIRKSSKKGIKKTGIMISLVGVENSGKSTFLNRFAGTRLKATDVPFETQEPAIGTIKYRDVDLHFIEIPSFYEGIYEKGELSNVIRISDLIVLFLDPTRDLRDQAELLRRELENMKIILGRSKKIIIERTERGGIEIIGLEKFKRSREDIIRILKMFRIYNAKVVFEEEADAMDLVRILDKGYVFKKFLFVINKCDIKRVEGFINISSVRRIGIEKLLEAVWNKLDIKRIYTRSRGKRADKPIVFVGKVTVRDVCERIHEEFLERFRYAKVWGPSAKFPGQKVGLDHELKDGDVVEIFLK